MREVALRVTPSIAAEVSAALALWRPPRRLLLDEWADANYKLSSESAHAAGDWECIAYQREILRAMHDPRIAMVSVPKSARVGLTKCANIVVAHHIAEDPCPIMVMQPTVALAEKYSKKELAPMIRDCPVLHGRIAEPRTKGPSNTILEKAFLGGSVMMVGAQSGADLRAVSIRTLLADEVDGYPASAGEDGDPISLAIARTGYFWNRKIICISTPLNEGESRIEELYAQSDQRRYYVPCPHCGHFDVLVWRDPEDPDDNEPGHWLTWPEGDPDGAYVVCSSCGAGIDHKHKREMVNLGEWRASRPIEETLDANGRGHAGFHIWAAYSFSPNATWPAIVREYLQAVAGGPLKLKTFTNTVLGRTWRVKGDAPKANELWARRERYQPNELPAAVEYVTVGVDVQEDRVIYEAVGWAADQSSWSIEIGEIPGKTSTATSPVWDKLDALLARTWRRADGRILPVSQLAIDSGYNAQIVYAWVRRHDRRRVMAVKGEHAEKADKPITGTSECDVKLDGTTIPGGVVVWHLAVNKLKEELYGWLHLPPPESGQPFPAGWCHFPDHPASYFDQLTAERRLRGRNKRGEPVTHWVQTGENHHLDARNYARAAAIRLGVDRLPARPPAPPQGRPAGQPGNAPRRTGWLSGRSGRRGDRPWLG